MEELPAPRAIRFSRCRRVRWGWGSFKMAITTSLRRWQNMASGIPADWYWECHMKFEPPRGSLGQKAAHPKLLPGGGFSRNIKHRRSILYWFKTYGNWRTV